jgi:hypothetical protein
VTWVAAETAYNERVARVENQIISRLRDQLGIARNAAESFRVFSKFNALFVRPKIRGAVQEYQTTLIDQVKEDIRRLHEKYKTQYRFSEAYHMSQLRDLPPIAGAIIWARQIERQLTAYMQRVQDVLGSGWELYAEGQKLASESTSFKRKLDTRAIYEAWLHEINRRDMQINGRLFEITRNRSAGGTLQLGVNFDPQIITLFKVKYPALVNVYMIKLNLEYRRYATCFGQASQCRTRSATLPKMRSAYSLLPSVSCRLCAHTARRSTKYKTMLVSLASWLNIGMTFRRRSQPVCVSFFRLPAR